MPDRAFGVVDTRPTEKSVEATMPQLYPRYRRLLDRAAGFTQEWSFSRSAQGGGWLLKVVDRKKALFFVVPCRGGFVVRLTVRPAEREELLHDPDLTAARPMLTSARTYREGSLLQFDVFDAGDGDLLEPIVDRLIRMRGR